MSSTEVQTGGPPETPFHHLRRFGAGILALVVGVSALTAAARRSADDITLVFRDAPLQIVPEGHTAQVKIVRSYMPRGAKLLYLMDNPEAWQLGLWQRSLYPDYVVIPVREAVGLDSPEIERLRLRHHIRFALATGSASSSPIFVWRTELPEYPNGIPLVFGRLTRRIQQ